MRLLGGSTQPAATVSALDLARWQFAVTTIYHFLFVPVTIGLVWFVAAFQTAWHRTRRRALAAADALLRKAVPDQLRARRRHRHRAGVPVRDELVGVLALRRRHLRRAARDRGAGRVLPRVDVPRALDLRLGPPEAEGAPRDASGSSRSGRPLSAYFILAANSWMQHPVGYRINPVTRPRGADVDRRRC